MNDGNLKKLVDTLDIETVKALYCEAADLTTKDGVAAAGRLAEVFTDDAQANFGELGLFNGPRAIIDFLVKDIGANSEWMWHGIHSPRIEVKGDKAAGYWTIVARLRPNGGTTATLVGRYVDEFRRTPAGWKISSLHWIAEG